MIQSITNYVNSLVNGNEIATGMILTGMLGYATYFSKRVPMFILEIFKKHMTTTLHIRSSDEVYHQLMSNLTDGNIVKKVRSIKFTSWFKDYSIGTVNYKSIGYGNHIIKYDNKYMMFNMTENTQSSSEVKTISISITKLGRSHKIFDDMFKSLQKAGEEEKDKYLKFKRTDNSFISRSIKPKKDAVIMSEANEKLFWNTIDNFVAKEQWHIDKSVPYHLGILLHGVAGTGKTSLMKVLAAYLNRDIIIVNSIAEFEKACRHGNQYIIVVEEVDTLGVGKRNIDNDESEDVVNTITTSSDESPQPKKFKRKEESVDPNAELYKAAGNYSLGVVLQSLDGLIQPHGRIIIMSTNNIDALDKAMLRSGRVDLKLNLGYADEYVFKGILKKFFDDVTDKDFEGFKIKPKVPPVDIQKYILQGENVEQLKLRFGK